MASSYAKLLRESGARSLFGTQAVALVWLVVVAGACGDHGAPPATGEGPIAARVSRPFLRVLGTAQDGGLPHAACSCERCEAARREPYRARAIASLALVLPGREAPEVYLVDASPDLRHQLDTLRDLRPGPGDRVDRSPVDGIFLTHAHIGHYLGLAFFGFEAISAQDLPVWATPRMAAFLRGHGPWSQLVDKGNIAVREIPPGGVTKLGQDGTGLRIASLPVPHRDELSDTVAYRIEGPAITVLYVPDTDTWESWDPSLETALEGVDVALLDATFYSMDELPGRDITQVRHPLITHTMDRLQEAVDAGELRVYFTHLNHTNPALEPDSPQAQEIHRRGFAIAKEGQEIPL